MIVEKRPRPVEMGVDYVSVYGRRIVRERNIRGYETVFACSKRVNDRYTKNQRQVVGTLRRETKPFSFRPIVRSFFRVYLWKRRRKVWWPRATRRLFVPATTNNSSDVHGARVVFIYGRVANRNNICRPSDTERAVTNASKY